MSLSTLRAIAHTAQNQRRGLTPTERQDFEDAEQTLVYRTPNLESPFARLDHYEKEAGYAVDFGQWLRYRPGEMGGMDPQTFANRHLKTRALATSPGSAGGFAVPDGFNNEIKEAQEQIGGIAQAGVSLVQTNGGEDYPWPSHDGSAETGRLITENASMAEGTDSDFDQSILKAWTYTSDIIKVAIQLLQDQDVALEEHIAGRLGKRLGRAWSPHYIDGSGVAQPEGILTANEVTVGVTAAATNSFTRAEVAQLVGSVDAAAALVGEFVISPSAQQILLESAVQFPEYVINGTLMGRPVTVDASAPAVATGVTSPSYSGICPHTPYGRFAESQSSGSPSSS